MIDRALRALSVALFLMVSVIAPSVSAQVWINEIHYDDDGADAGEGVELAGPAGTDLTGWRIVPYNGNNGLNYTPEAAVSGTIPNQQNGFGTLWFPISGLQNGAPDGIALIEPDGDVAQFLSYEGGMTSADPDGPVPSGTTSTDIGVSETDDGEGLSLQLTGTGNQYSDFTWTGPIANTQGAINTGQTFTAAGPVVPVLAIDNVTQTEGNAGTSTFTFTVSLTAPAGVGGVTFDIATANDTATAGSDYIANSLTGQTIPAGNSTYSFNVTVNGDVAIEPTETFLVNVTNIVGADAGDTQGTGTITNDDSPPVLTIADVSLAEGNGPGSTMMTFTVSLDAPAPPGGVTFDITTTDGTATTADSDYVGTTVVGAAIGEGLQTYTFEVPINGDTAFEGDETFTVTVSNVTGATAGDVTATGTITNDDSAPAISIASAAILEGGAGTQDLTFTVSLNKTSVSTITVDYATSDSSATVAGADYVAETGTLTFLPGETTQTFTITVNGDAVIEGDEQFLVTLSNPTGSATITNTTTSPNPALGVIKSDDPFSIAAVNTAYSQNFDGLADTGTAATTPATWTFVETGSAANLTYAAGNGGSNTGNTYSFGETGSSDRAFGSLLSSSVTPTLGARYVNDTGVAITSLSIAYTGELWRTGTTGRSDQLDFAYSTDATSLGSGTWTDVNQLDFVGPVSGTTGAKDGNVDPNRTAIAYTITGLNIAPGQTFWIKWTDVNSSGADDGLAIDDLSILANVAGGVLTIGDATVTEGDAGQVTATFTVTLSEPAGVGGVTFDIATADNTATVADNDYVANAVIGANIPQGSTTYTFDVLVNGDTNVENTETFFVNITNLGGAAPNDVQGVGTIGSDDFTFTAIHDVQGSGLVSPLNGATVTIGGIVTGIKSGGSGGFFVQEEDAEYDADPNTSEGIFVFTGGSLPAGVVIGNQVAVTGTVSEFPTSASPHAVTELSGVTVDVMSTGNALPAPAILTTADGTPSSNLSQYERYEGMRVTGTFTVVAPTEGSIDENDATAGTNGVFYAVIAGNERPFREPGIEQTYTIPAEAPCPACIDRFDENPEKIRVDSDNQPGTTALNVVVGQTVAGLTGVLDYGFFEYTLLPEPGSPVVSGDSTADPIPAPLATELTISGFNMLHFFDAADDPGAGEVVLTPAAFEARLTKASLGIRNILLTPDVIGVVEADNLTTLQTLAARVNSDTGGETNYAAYLEEGNDVGGIDVGFLVDLNRVAVQSVTQVGKDTTWTNPHTGLVESNPLNDRPPLVLEASITRPDSTLYEFVVIVNHLRSLIGVQDDTASGRRVRAKRAAQAEFLASYVQSRQVADPTERIILVGDFNAFEFNDGFVDVMGTIKGTPAPSTEVVEPTDDLVNPDLTNLIETLPADQRYTYEFDGNAQAIDHALVNAPMLATLSRFVVAHLNADYPTIFYGDPNRPERLSDHDATVSYFNIAAATGVTISDATVAEGNAGTSTLQFTVTLAAPATEQIVVNYTTSDGTANAGTDYVAETATVTFEIGQTTQLITIDVNGDLTFEADETMTVTLTASSGNSMITDPAGTGTILNDDLGTALLSASMVITPAQPTAGAQFTKTITVSNAGPQTATNVLVTDDLPDGLTFISATTTQGSCNAADPVACTLGNILAGASVTVTITAQATTAGAYTNIAMVSSTENPAGVVSTTTFTVAPAALAAAQIPTLSEYALFGLLSLLAALAVMKLK